MNERNLLARCSLALAIFSALLGSTAPSPLYPLYIEEFGLSRLMATAIFAIYALGTLGALFLAPMLVRFARDERFVILPGLALTALGALMFASAHNVEVLLLGRFLNGSGTGIITGLSSAALYELAPPKARKTAAMVATLAFTGGAAGGPMMTSLAIGADFYPFVTPFVAIASFAMIAFAGLCQSLWPTEIQSFDPEPSDGRPPAFTSALPFASLFFLACLSVGVAWVIGSVLMALGPSLGLEVYGLASASVAGFVPALFQLFAGVGQYAWGRTSSLKAIAYGTLGIAATQAILLAAAMIQNALLLLLIMPFCGFFYGAAFVGALALVNASVDPERRSTYVARFYTVGYLSNALPTLALGLLSDVMGLKLTFYLFSELLIVLALLAALQASGYRRRMAAQRTF